MFCKLKVINQRFLTICLLALTLCQSSCDSSGRASVSNNINESKDRNVFISEYQVSPNPYIINDTIRLKVLNAWVEYHWAFGNTHDETIIDTTEYQLILEVESGNLKNYSSTWRIGLNESRYFRSCGKSCLISDFKYLPKKIEEWSVQKGWKLDSISKKEIIGIFKIERKT